MVSLSSSSYCFSILAIVVSLSKPYLCDLNIKATKDGKYDITVNGKLWLSSGDTAFHVNNRIYSLFNKTLISVKDPASQSGQDVLGRFVKYEYSYSANSSLINAAIQSYEGTSVIKFIQHYKNGAEETSVHNMDGVISSFPTFKLGTNEIQLGVMVYADVFAGWVGLRIERWEKAMKKLPDGIDGGPIVLFDDKDNVIIISPFNHFMAASFSHNTLQNTVSWGIMGNVNTVPKQFTLETLVVYSDKGINEAMNKWGSILRKWYNRDTSSRESDLTINYLGYYTDNGAYYYHHTEPGLNYEDTLLEEFKYYKSLNIPYRYLQLDDWWYYIETSKTGYGAVMRWESMPSVFPHGLQWLYNASSLPVIAHNRYWSYKTPYAKQNGGKYDFIIDEDTGFALPIQEEFWDFLFKGGLEWGLVNYEQDFLITQVKKIKELNSDIYLGEQWLKQMGNAAMRYNLKLQYCMSLPRHILAAMEVPPVSHARASDDYVIENQWKIGYTSIFLDAVGIAPFKDNFWTTDTQTGNPYARKEVHPAREAVIALLSTGPVGISDRINCTNPIIAKALARKDGLLLKPSKPATAIDQQIIQRAFGGVLGSTGEVYTTYSDISDIRFGIIFASQLKQDFIITPSMAGFNKKFGNEMVIYPLNMRYNDKSVTQFSEYLPYVLKKFNNTEDMHLFYTSPVFTLKTKNIVIIGELNKYVPISPNRIDRIMYETEDIIIVLSGQEGEIVQFSILYPKGLSVIYCTIGRNGHATLSMADKSCV